MTDYPPYLVNPASTWTPEAWELYEEYGRLRGDTGVHPIYTPDGRTVGRNQAENEVQQRLQDMLGQLCFMTGEVAQDLEGHCSFSLWLSIPGNVEYMNEQIEIQRPK